MKQRNWYVCALALVVLLLATALVLPLTRGESPIKLGSDLAGGVLVTYRPDFTTVAESHREMTRDEILATAKDNLSARLERTLKLIPDVNVRDDETIVVTLPAGEDHKQTLDLVGRTHRLTLSLVVAEHDDVPSAGDGRTVYPYEDRYLELAPPQFSGDMLDPRAIRVDNGSSDPLALTGVKPQVAFRFAVPHDLAFARFTRENAGRQLAILLDDHVEWAGEIRGAIRGDGVLAGDYTMEQAIDITQMLRSGTLPVSLDVESLSTVGPTLGQSIQDMGLHALSLALAGLVLVLAFSYLHRSWFLLASLCSLGCLLFLLTGLAASLGLTLDVVGIAGIILSVGMGMDACILVLESLDEKLRRPGAKPGTSGPGRLARAAYSFSGEGRTLFHANATTLLVVGLLLATDRLKSFALFMLVGIVASILTILVTREVLPRVHGWLPDLRWEPLGWLRRSNVRLFRARKLYFAALICGLVLVGGWMLLGGPGGPSLELGPDFRAGTQLVVLPEGPDNLAASLDLLEERLPDVGIRQQTLGPPEQGRYLVTVGAPVAERAAEAILGQGNPTAEEFFSIFETTSVEVESLNSIDDKVSGRRLLAGLSVLLFSFLLLAAYLVFLQEPLNRLLSSSPPPPGSRRSRGLIFAGIMLAIFLDVAVMLAALSVLGQPISLAVVAGILAVIGYSVNDSVVLWCHVQNLQTEMRREGKSFSPLELVTTAIDRILSRALLTTLSTVLPAAMILAVGLTPLADFAWVVLAGTVTGTLSSIFIVGSFALRALRHDGSAETDNDEPQAVALGA
ncbi:hypothetical protein ABI59_22515 [Acidobacteria bacterium Mor1]|nr:hypothetical protein ABI59_22515 [Acidobacteria bacterium Mor1]